MVLPKPESSEPRCLENLYGGSDLSTFPRQRLGNLLFFRFRLRCLEEEHVSPPESLQMATHGSTRLPRLARFQGFKHLQLLVIGDLAGFRNVRTFHEPLLGR